MGDPLYPLHNPYCRRVQLYGLFLHGLPREITETNRKDHSQLRSAGKEPAVHGHVDNR